MSKKSEGICGVCGKSRIECCKSGTFPCSESGDILMPINDPINHPSHYTDGGIETIDFIEAKGLNYNCGNATKYISRAGKKDKAERAVDIAKAI